MTPNDSGLTQRALINPAGAAAIGSSAGTLAGCASTAAAATESTEGSGAALASTCPPAIRIVAVAIALSLTLLTSAAASAADPVSKAAAASASPSGPQTLTGDWFGQGPALRDAGFDFRLEWSQFYQGMTRGEGDKIWQYGGKLDAQARVDLSQLGFWNGLSVTAQGHLNYGHSVNGLGGSLLQVNTALAFPGIEGADRSDIMALYVTQRFGDRVSVSLGKFNMLEVVRARPLAGGIGPDTFWNANVGPVTGVTPPILNGAQIRISTQPVSYTSLIGQAS
jgi:porin